MEEQQERQPTVPASDSLAQTKEQWLREGRDYYRVGRGTEALRAFEEVIRLDSKNVEAYYMKSYILYAMLPEDGERSEEVIHASQQALNVAELAILLNPTDADAYCYQGMALSDLERYEEAIAAYEQLIRLDPKNSTGYNNKGNALAALNRHEEAIGMYEQVLRLDPNNKRMYVSIGHSLRSLGRITEAQQAYEKARGNLPRNAQ